MHPVGGLLHGEAVGGLPGSGASYAMVEVQIELPLIDTMSEIGGN